MYFTLSTIVTVGYGDITAHTSFEKVYTLLFLVLGVWVYTNAISLFSKVSKSEQ